jgi:hypothetical protein
MNRLNLSVVVATTTTFAVIAYLLCAAFRPLFPTWPMYDPIMWQMLFPGFSWTLSGVLVGLVEVALYAAVGSALFVGLYNFFAARLAPVTPPRA